MRILAIESTAHTIGVSVVSSSARSAKAVSLRNTEVLSNERAKYPSTDRGYIPRQLADHHAKKYAGVLEAALRKSKTAPEELDCIAYTQGPGIGHCLRVGFVAANSLSKTLEVPLVPVNHAIAHVEVGNWACGTKDPLVIYVSGGNTQIAAKTEVREKRKYAVLGETLDIGIGNFLDVLGREFKCAPPDAVGLLEEAAKGGNLFDLPYTVKGVDLAFAGLLTAVTRAVGGKKTSRRDACFSSVQNAFAMLVEASERVLCHTRNGELLLVGGVAQSKTLQEMYSLMAREQGAKSFVVPAQYAGDQAGMIGITAVKQVLAGMEYGNYEPNQDLRIDAQEIPW
ncbi:UGMP family protein [Candidatus Micrarchaeota archaeon]|nr:UGMP family protein [Candidatus Micrarchaeota archaeon]MBI5177413.1 UGMP family protein [Candidatus Micrarchaeota archaeon]